MTCKTCHRPNRKMSPNGSCQRCNQNKRDRENRDLDIGFKRGDIVAFDFCGLMVECPFLGAKGEIAILQGEKMKIEEPLRNLTLIKRVQVEDKEWG